MVNFARKLRQQGIGPFEFPRLVIHKSAERIREGDLETGFWEMSPDADKGMGLILRVWAAPSTHQQSKDVENA